MATARIRVGAQKQHFSCKARTFGLLHARKPRLPLWQDGLVNAAIEHAAQKPPASNSVQLKRTATVKVSTQECAIKRSMRNLYSLNEVQILVEQ